MKNWKELFNGKKVTLMGLGLLGRGVGDALFLAKCGAKLTVTDLRDEKTLAPSLAKLKKYKDIQYTLGGHAFADFRDRDFILKAAGVPLDSPYIAEARKNGIPVEMDASLFAKLMPKGVTLVGVTGTRGKSTTTALIYEILSQGSALIGKKVEPCKVFKGGNLVPEATLPLLEKVRTGDIVVVELDSWQLQGFHDAEISPQVAVFTTFLDDHLIYYTGDRKRYFEDKTAIFKYQKANDVFIVGERAAGKIRKQKLKSKIVKATAQDVPKTWRLKLLGEHNRANIACAVAAARALGIADAVIKRAVEAFRGMPGRLEYLRTINGVKIYNDNSATTPDATLAALRALDTGGLDARKKIVLIMGGTDKGLDMSKLVAEIPKHCKIVVLLKETGTDKLLAASCQLLGRDFMKLSAKSYQLKATDITIADTLQECIRTAMKLALRGDTILFSPAFASFGKWFQNEYDRGEQFVRIVSSL